MMEQNRLNELPFQFPRITKPILDRLLKEFWGSAGTTEQALNIDQGLEVDDPVLYRGIYIVAQTIEDSALFLTTARFTYKALKSLEEQGYNLPPVTIETVETLAAEMDTAKRALSKFSGLNVNALSPEEKTERLKEFEEISRSTELVGLGFYDWSPLSPYEYSEENPALMTWLGSQSPSRKLGGMFVYVLKRRQFFADQLKKQLGE